MSNRTTNVPGPSAREIIEAMLRRTADAILAGDFDALNACFRLPFTIETQSAKIIVETEAQHREIFVRLVEGYRSKRVTEIVRVCDAAEFVSPKLIRSLHTSHTMAGDKRVDDASSTLATVELFEDGWRITDAQYVAQSNIPIGRALSLLSKRIEPGVR